MPVRRTDRLLGTKMTKKGRKRRKVTKWVLFSPMVHVVMNEPCPSFFRDRMPLLISFSERYPHQSLR